MAGAGLCLLGAGDRRVVVYGTDPLARELEDLQVDLGEGPAVQAARTGVAVLVPDLVVCAPPCWPGYAAAARARGARGGGGGGAGGPSTGPALDAGLWSPRWSSSAASSADAGTLMTRSVPAPRSR